MGIQEQIDDARNSYEQISASDNPSAELEQKVRMHPKGISQDDYNTILASYDGAGLVGQYVSSNLALLAHANQDAQTFYRRLWEIITSDSMLPNQIDKIIALLFVLVSQSLPYFDLRLTRMEQSEFAERQRDLGDAIAVIRHIAVREFDQATEEASALLDAVLRYEDERDRTVLLATYILMVRQ